MSQNANLDVNNPALQASLAEKLAQTTDLLRDIAANFSPATLASSLGAEDMVLTDLILRNKLDIEIFSLDTGRLPAETYTLMAAVQKHYDYNLKLYYPRHELIEAYTHEHGINAFYDSVELRKGCCYIRKV